MNELLIVYHTMTGGSRQMAQAARRGAEKEEAIRVRVIEALHATGHDLVRAHAYIFVTPENLGSMAGVMKDFFDRAYYVALDRVEARPYATLVCAGSDGQNAVRQIERICNGWRLKPVAEPVIVCTHAQTPETILAPKTIGSDDLARCEEVGAALAAGLALGVF